jgi:hypothetical protein
MSRTTLCIATAVGLITLSCGLMVARYRILGEEVLAPKGPGIWKVTLLVNGTSTTKDAKLMTATPIDFGHQHICRESCRSGEFLDKPPLARHPERRQVVWNQRGTKPPGPFRVLYEFYCQLDLHRATTSGTRLSKALYAPPHPGEYLNNEAHIECDQPEISAVARRLTAAGAEPSDQVEALYRYVNQEIGKEPAVGAGGLSAVQCLKNGRGDSGAKSRLLIALCRNRGIPARMVTGLTLARGKGQEQVAHYWVEAWVQEHWKPMCSFHHYDGHVPSTFLIFGFGDVPIVRGKLICDLDYAFLAEPSEPEESPSASEASLIRRLFRSISFDALPPPEERLVEFLLLLPVAALMVCIFRNVIGLNSFGTFAPALVGLAFRELESLPGILVFLSLVLVGWGMRRILDQYHLLQVPRTAFMLSLVVAMLIAGIVTANFLDLPATKFIPLFPMVILTGMIERFWTLEVEDGTFASFKTMLGTMSIAATIAVVLGMHAVVNFLFRFPEALGFIMASQLMLGRYTGYRLSELFRFRDLIMSASS